MNTQRHLFAALAATLALGLAIPSFAFETVTEAQIAAAKTPADHEAIAKAYESKALAAEADAKGHEAMARTYKVGGTPKGNSAAMAGHCDRLVKSYRAAATEYRALADEHRRLAAALK